MKFSLKLSAVLGLGLTVLAASGARAADQLTLINGALNVSVPYSQLKTLSETGVADGNLVLLLDNADESTESARAFLNQRIEYPLDSADALFNGGEGEALLNQLGSVIMPRNTHEDGKQALRAAIIKSLSGDNVLTPLEIVANYPVDAQVDVIRLRKENSTYAGIDKVVALMKSKMAISKAAAANQELDERFAQMEQRKQDRMQAMWAGVGMPRQVAAEVNSPIRGLW
jgi:hypothetical protein